MFGQNQQLCGIEIDPQMVIVTTRLNQPWGKFSKNQPAAVKQKDFIFIFGLPAKLSEI